MKHLLSRAAIAVMAAALVAGCSNESELELKHSASDAMRFSLTQRNLSRGTATTSTNYLDQIQGFQVWGHYTAGATGEGVNPGELYVGESGTVGTFIKGDGAGAWDYEDILDRQYWPATTAPLNFQAITPATDASFTATVSPDIDGRLTAVVTVPAATADQKDIMLSASLNQTRETNAQCVALTFKHAMSQVVFGARMASEKITAEIASIEIANVHAQGTVGFADDYSLYANVTDDAAATYSVGLDNAKTTLTTAATVNVTAQDGALFMLPQTVPAWQTAVGSPKALSDADVNHNSYLKVRCTVTDNTSQTVLINDGYVYIPFAIDWEQGKKYAYTLVFGDLAGGFDESGAPLENLLPVSYTVQEVEEWNAVDGGEFGIGGEIVVPGPDETTHDVAGYAVTSTSTPTKLVNSLSGITEMWIEKVDATRAVSVPVRIEPCLEYTFKETGNYKMYFKFEGTTIADNMFKDCVSLTSIVIPEGVKTIGEYAFNGCASLQEITFPFTLYTIGDYAFQGCIALGDIEFRRGLSTIGKSAFEGCTALKSLSHITATEIGDYAFKGCTALTEAGFNVYKIGREVFSGCKSLTSVYFAAGHVGYAVFSGCNALTKAEFSSIESLCNTNFESPFSNPLHFAGHLYINGQEVKDLVIPEGVTTIGSNAFRRGAFTSVTFPSTLTTINYAAFSGCASLTSVDIPEGVTSLGQDVFSSCTSLTSVTLPSTLESIGMQCFNGSEKIASVYISDLTAWCNLEFSYDTSNPLYYGGHLYINGQEVKDLVIPEGVTNIGKYAFYGCKFLTSIVIPEGVTSIGKYAFFNCSNLTSIPLPSTLESIGENAFSGCTGLTEIVIPEGVTSISSSAFERCSNLTEIVIPEGVTSISSSAFFVCSKLTSISLPSTLESIGGRAFESCSNLTEIVIPEGVTEIGKTAFRECSKLTSISLPSTLESIGEKAFYKCSSLSSIVCKATTAPSTATATFTDVKTAGVLTVPTGATGYDEWMKNESGYLGYRNWTIQYSDAL